MEDLAAPLRKIIELYLVCGRGGHGCHTLQTLAHLARNESALASDRFLSRLSHEVEFLGGLLRASTIGDL